MHIDLPKRVLEKMTEAELVNIGRTPSNVRGLTHLEVNLSRLTDDAILTLNSTLERMKASGMRMMNPMLDDIRMWRNLVEEGATGSEIPSTLRQFSDLLVRYIHSSSPGHRVYKQERGANNWLPYYCNFIQYYNEVRQTKNRDFEAARVCMTLLCWELGVYVEEKVWFFNSDVDRRTIARSLADKGVVIETPELRRHYLERKDKFDAVFDEVGRQYKATGRGREVGDRGSISDWGIPMASDGIPSKVVVDAVGPEDKKGGSVGAIQPNFWSSTIPVSMKPEDSDDLFGNRTNRRVTNRDETEALPEIPVHPNVIVYHMGHHHRYLLSAENLEPYEFNPHLSDQLVLPERTKTLVDVLVNQGRISFSDIVEGKGSGACVLLIGPPGVGKTLTAEVFAESTERSLLSVQSAQLGTSADTIEKNLQRILQIGSRFNSVVLLDEADVYIAERGSNVQQNAIVAAFLRVLERHTATIFLTTNRADDVDDAIASRCIARVDYGMPTVEDQKEIWKVLSRLNDVRLSDQQIDEIVRRQGNLSGRDIKHLLKLAELWSSSRQEPVTPDTIDFATGFLATRPAAEMHQPEAATAA